MENKDDRFRFVEYSAEAAERSGYSDYSYWRSVFQNFFKKKSAVFMVFVFLAVVFFSFIALRIGNYTYSELKTNSSTAFIRSFDSEFWFGTDNLGRDYWCQVWYAAQISIRLALIVALGECIVGVIIGCLWGYVRWLDRPITEVYNIMSNVPTIIYMTLIALLVGQSFKTMAFSLIATGWLTMARNVRNLVLMHRDREYNLASRCLGTPVRRVLSRNLLPYLVSVIILRLALSIPGTIGINLGFKDIFGRMRFRAMNVRPDDDTIGFAAFSRWYEIKGHAVSDDLMMQVFGHTDANKSFPSGHTGAAGTSYALIMLNSTLQPKSKSVRALFWLLPVLFTGLVAVSRMMVGAHFFSDVLIGGTFSFVLMIIAREIFIFKGANLKALFTR